MTRTELVIKLIKRAKARGDFSQAVLDLGVVYFLRPKEAQIADKVHLRTVELSDPIPSVVTYKTGDLYQVYKYKWDRLPVPKRVKLCLNVGLPTKDASKNWLDLTKTDRNDVRAYLKARKKARRTKSKK